MSLGRTSEGTTRSSPRLPRLLTVAGLVAICMGATASTCSFNNIVKSSGGGSQPSFVVNMQLQDVNGSGSDTFQVGDPITMVMTIRNRLDTSATIEFPTARQSDFVVVQANTSNVVWKWSDNRTFPQTATKLDFAAGETKTVTVTWNQIGSDNVQVIAGTYEARGVLVYSNFDASPLEANQQGSTLERFTIIQ
jgi:hypothetical protein